MTLFPRILAAVMLLGAGAAHAQQAVIGSAYGTFSNLSSCDSSGSDRDCRIVNTAANGANTQVQWGSQHQTNDFVNPSYLTSVDVSFNTYTPALGIVVGRLDWYNSATLRLNNSLDTFAVRWTLNVNFTAPTGRDPNGREVFNFSIRNPINPVGDSLYGLELADLRNLDNSIDLDGVVLGNFRYQVVDGAGAGTSFLGNNWWYNDESNHSSLRILADVVGVTTPVPEPETYALLLAGLGVIALSRRRRKAA